MKINHVNKKRDQNIEIISRVFILVGNKVLLCKQIGSDYCFFPGGHVEFGEGAKETLVREIKEETGALIKNLDFIGIVEHHWEVNKQKHHEINLVFSGKIEGTNFQSREDHIEFVLKDLKSFAKEKVLPRTLRDAIVEWLKNKKPFWREYEE